MKTLTKFGMAMMIAFAFVGCKSSQQTTNAEIERLNQETELIKAKQRNEDAKAQAEQAEKQRQANAAVGEEIAKKQAARAAQATEMPCQMYDDDEWFYATGMRQVKANSFNTAATATLRATQQQMRQKLSALYRSVTRDYFDQMDTEEGSYERSHIESAGDLVVRAMINDTYEVCRKNTDPDDNGNMIMYMTIKASKKKFLDTAVNALTKDKELEVRFNEKQFRDSAFKVFEDSNEKEYNEFKENQQ